MYNVHMDNLRLRGTTFKNHYNKIMCLKERRKDFKGITSIPPDLSLFSESTLIQQSSENIKYIDSVN